MNTNSSFSIAGQTPHEIENPTTPESLGQIIALAAKAKLALVPWGGGTLQHLGNAPHRYDIAVVLTSMKNIVEYAPDDLTITVQAGATIDEVKAELAAHHQFLPLDPALPACATIGGTLATNATGPLRLRYGPARDFTLGMSVVNAEGKITKSGGKVVKNVAGYELPKLYIGALGTLGIITQVTFKVFPKPREEITAVTSFATASLACKTVRALWNMTTPPAAIEIFDAKVAKLLGLIAHEDRFVVAARFAGSKSVMRAATLKAREVAEDGNATSVEVVQGESIWNDVANLPTSLRERHAGGALFQIGLPPAQLKDAMDIVADLFKNLPYEFYAHAATATGYLAFEANDDKIVAACKHLRAALSPMQAHVIVLSASPRAKENATVWGDPGAAHFIARRLKEKFDPHTIFNPGRFVGGL